VALSWSELDQQPAAATHVLAGSRGHLDRAVDHEEPRALVDLMVGQRLARREVERDRARRLAGGRISGNRGLRSSVLNSSIPG
jgi:hypothetical protein